MRDRAFNKNFFFVGQVKRKILTGIFFWAMATTQSLPRIATVVKPP